VSEKSRIKRKELELRNKVFGLEEKAQEEKKITIEVPQIQEKPMKA
jgi:hypothetical protein